MDEDFNKDEQIEIVRKIVADIVTVIEKAIKTTDNNDKINHLKHIRSAFQEYPPMFEELLDNAYLVQGAINDIGAEKFMRYAEIFAISKDLADADIFPSSLTPRLLVEIMKYCVLQGIKYGQSLQKYDNTLFSNYINDL